MKEICEKAVDQHLKLCDTIVADLCDVTLEVDEEILQTKLLGIEPDHAYEYHEEAKMLVDDYQRRIMRKMDEPVIEFQ